MYKPKIGRVYKHKENQIYYLITSFENPNMNEVRVNFQIPGTNQVFEYKGIHQVSDFLHSIEPVSSVSSELENITQQEIDLSQQAARLQSQRDFLQSHSKPQKTEDEIPDQPGGQVGGAATLHFG